LGFYSFLPKFEGKYTKGEIFFQSMPAYWFFCILELNFKFFKESQKYNTFCVVKTKKKYVPRKKITTLWDFIVFCSNLKENASMAPVAKYFFNTCLLQVFFAFQ